MTAAPRRKALPPRKPGRKNGSTRAGRTPNHPVHPGTSPKYVFVATARRVCATLGLDTLAKRYHVAANAESVATAYAASYPPSYRTAVHDGCKSAL